MTVATLTTAARFAFFDVDETIVHFKSMFSFHQYWCEHEGPFASVVGAWRHRQFLDRMARHLAAGRSREYINDLYYRGFAGRSRDAVLKCVEHWFDDMQKAPGGIWIPATLAIVRRHQRDGAQIVLVSGSFHELLQPIADALGADHVLATRLEVRNGRYTGRLIPPQMIGAGKAAAVRTFLAAEACDARLAWAYGDHISDMAMLEEVGHPNIVSNEPHMVSLANDRGWGLVDPRVGPTGE